MIKTQREKIGVPFHPLTKEEIKQWYRDKLLTSAGYLLAIKKVTRPPGKSLLIPNVLKFCEEWEISKSAFYRAVNELREKGYTDWEATHGIILNESQKVISFSSEKKCPTSGIVSHKRETNSHKRNTVSHKRETNSHERNTVSHKREKCASKPASDNDSSAPQIDQSYSDFKDSLSEGEREDFLKFGLKLAAELPKPPTLRLKWIEKNFEDIRFQWFQTRSENENQSQKYNFAAYSEPQHQMWYEKLQNVVCGITQSGDTARLEQFLKDDFYSSWLNWAKTAREDVREFLASNPILTENLVKAQVSNV